MAHSGPKGIIRIEVAAGVLIACALCSGIATADDAIVDWDAWRVHVENWIGAASVAVPSQVGALATGISAAPASVQGSLTLKCHENMQRITLELDNPNLDPARKAQLQLMMDKNQHVVDALNGKPEGLRRFIKQLERQGGGVAAAAPAPTMLDDDRDSMEFFLAQYAKKIKELQERASKERNRFEGLRSEGEKLVDGLDDIAKGAETTREFLVEPFTVNDEACELLVDKDTQINAYAVVVVDARTACETALAQAEQTAANCRTQADADLIRARYEEAKQHGAQMVRDVEHILVEAGERTRLLDLVKKLDPTDVAISTREKAVADLKRVEQDRKTVERTAADLQDSRTKLVNIEKEAKDLLARVRRHRDDYVPLFPQSADRWQALIDPLVTDLALTAPERDQASLGWEEAAREARRNLDELLDLELSTCKADERTPRMVDEAVAARDLALLKLAAAEHVLAAANNCGRQPAAPPAPQPTPTPVGPSIQLLPATTTATGTALAGGLRITGPASMTDGQRAVFVGTDGAGTPYPSGVTWNTSAEDVLLIGADGGAVAEKPGHATVIAHHGDKTAFFDVQVLPDEASTGAAAGFSSAGGGAVASGSSSTSGGQAAGAAPGPSGNAGTGFSSAGGQAVSVPGPTNVGVQPTGTAGPDCAELEASFNTAIELGDLRWAQSIVNSSGDCPFYSHASAVYQGENDRVQAELAAADADRERQRCAELGQRFEAALATGNWQDAQMILRAATGCGFQSGGYSRLEQAVLNADCRQLYRQYQQHMANGAAGLARTVLQIAQSKGCQVGTADIHAVNQAIQQQQAQALQQQQQQQQAQIDSFNAFMATIGSVIQMQQGQGGSTSSLDPNRLPPAGTGATLPTGGPTGDPINAGGWTSPTATQPPSSGGGGTTGSAGSGGGQGSDIGSGVRYPYQQARDRGCLEWRGYWSAEGTWRTGYISSWGHGDVDTACAPRQGKVVTKHFDKCLGQERCFTTR
jgi:hypothetical protein